MSADDLIKLIDMHNWIVGPRFRSGARNGWFVYADWEASDQSNYSIEPEAYAIGYGATLEDAVRMALKNTGVMLA